MAKNDYFVVVYNILAYLYRCLKNGEKVDALKISVNGQYCQGINEEYWKYIIENLYVSGFINKIIVDRYDDEFNAISLDNCQITPLGIEYLMENSMLEKAKKCAKTVAEVFVAIK